MRYDDPNVAISAVIGIISAILLFVIVVVLQAFFYGAQQTEMEKKVLTRPNEALQQLNASQQELLGSYGWLSEGDGVVRIPIERAMELVAAESR